MPAPAVTAPSAVLPIRPRTCQCTRPASSAGWGGRSSAARRKRASATLPEASLPVRAKSKASIIDVFASAAFASAAFASAVLPSAAPALEPERISSAPARPPDAVSETFAVSEALSGTLSTPLPAFTVAAPAQYKASQYKASQRKASQRKATQHHPPHHQPHHQTLGLRRHRCLWLRSLLQSLSPAQKRRETLDNTVTHVPSSNPHAV